MRDLIFTSRTNPQSFLHVRSKYILIHPSSDELSEEFLHRSEKPRRIAIEEHSSVPVTHVIYKSARDDHGVQRVTLQECMGMFRAGSEAGVAEPIANQSFRPSGACSQHGNAGCYTLALSGQHTVAPFTGLSSSNTERPTHPRSHSHVLPGVCCWLPQIMLVMSSRDPLSRPAPGLKASQSSVHGSFARDDWLVAAFAWTKAPPSAFVNFVALFGSSSLQRGLKVGLLALRPIRALVVTPSHFTWLRPLSWRSLH